MTLDEVRPGMVLATIMTHSPCPIAGHDRNMAVRVRSIAVPDDPEGVVAWELDVLPGEDYTRHRPQGALRQVAPERRHEYRFHAGGRTSTASSHA